MKGSLYDSVYLYRLFCGVAFLSLGLAVFVLKRKFRSAVINVGKNMDGIKYTKIDDILWFSN